MTMDDFSQAADAGEVDPQEAPVPEQDVEPTPAEPEPQTEKPLSLEEYRQIAREEALRAAQSQVAKGENRIQRFIQEKFQALEASKGVLNLSDEQVAQAKKDIVAQAYEQPDAAAETTAPQPDAEAQLRSQSEFVFNQIDAVLAEHGVQITPNDPEFKTIDAALRDPQGSLAKTMLTTAKAAASKAQRLAQTKGSAPARVAGSGPQQPTTGAYDPSKPASYYLEKASKEQKP